MKALAEAGYRVVAPDQRGYGKTDRPETVEDYNILQLSGDIVGLVDALGETEAVIVGHDWGSAVAWFCALLRPDMFRAVVLLSVPYIRRSWMDIRPTEAMKQAVGGNEFYQLYFQEDARIRAIPPTLLLSFSFYSLNVEKLASFHLPLNPCVDRFALTLDAVLPSPVRILRDRAGCLHLLPQLWLRLGPHHENVT